MEIRYPQGAEAVLPIHTEPARMNQLAENRELIQAVRTVNAADLMGQDNELSFMFDRETQQPILRIVNRKTNEVIRQVPPEYVLQIARELRARSREGNR
jgi:uncharacterized FlaG/YvyC family protein